MTYLRLISRVLGVQVSFVGRAPPASAGHKIRVELNHDNTIEAELQDAAVGSSTSTNSSYRTWLTVDLPTGGSKPHFVHLHGLPSGTSLDYAVVKVGGDTPVSGQVAIVDEVDGTFTYAGWERKMGPMVVQDSVYYPYGGSMHAAKGVGDSMDVVFVGTSRFIAFRWVAFTELGRCRLVDIGIWHLPGNQWQPLRLLHHRLRNRPITHIRLQPIQRTPQLPPLLSIRPLRRATHAHAHHHREHVQRVSRRGLHDLQTLIRFSQWAEKPERWREWRAEGAKDDERRVGGDGCGGGACCGAAGGVCVYEAVVHTMGEGCGYDEEVGEEEGWGLGEGGCRP